MQCKDIPDLPVLEFIAKVQRGEITQTYVWSDRVQTRIPDAATWGWKSWNGQPSEHSVSHAMPPGAPVKLQLAKMQMLVRRGLVERYTSTPAGDYELTDKGRAYIAARRAPATPLRAFIPGDSMQESGPVAPNPRKPQ